MRRRLVLGVMLGITAFLAAGGAALYVAMRDRLVVEVDAGLDTVVNAASASIVYQLVRREHMGVPHDFDAYPLTDPTRRSDILYQLWLPDGTSARSDELSDVELPHDAGVPNAVTHFDVVLADGRRARAAALSITFRPDRPPESPFRPGRRALRDALFGPDGERPPWPPFPPRDDWDRLPFDVDAPLDERAADEVHRTGVGEVGNARDAATSPGPGEPREADADTDTDTATVDDDVLSGPGRRRGEHPIDQTAELVVVQDVGSVTSTLRHMRRMLALAWLMSVAGCALIVSWVVHSGLRPLQTLRAQIGAVDATRLDARFVLPDAPVELAPVIEQLNGLVGRLGEAFEREQAFTDHAAHELRTPLAGLRATLEVALLRKRPSEDHEASARQCLEIVILMHGMVETLLDLSRAGPSGRTPQRIDLDELVRHAFRPFAEQARGRSLDFELDVADDVRTATLDASLVERVLGNLLQNAVAHGDDGGAIAVRVDRAVHSGPEITRRSSEPSRTEGRESLRITVSNPAAHVTAEDASHAFDAFWRGDASRTGTGGHAGLGLTLCKRIVERLDGTICARTADGRFVVTVELPESRGDRA